MILESPRLCKQGLRAWEESFDKVGYPVILNLWGMAYCTIGQGMPSLLLATSACAHLTPRVWVGHVDRV